MCSNGVSGRTSPPKYGYARPRILSNFPLPLTSTRSTSPRPGPPLSSKRPLPLASTSRTLTICPSSSSFPVRTLVSWYIAYCGDLPSPWSVISMVSGYCRSPWLKLNFTLVNRVCGCLRPKAGAGASAGSDWIVLKSVFSPIPTRISSGI